MKKFFVIATLVAIVSGCTVKIEDSASPETTGLYIPDTTQPISTSGGMVTDDLLLSDFEYDLFYSLMIDYGYTNIISQSNAQSIGEEVCRLAFLSNNSTDFVTRVLNTANTYGVDSSKFGEVAGALMAAMCQDEFDRLGLSS